MSLPTRERGLKFKGTNTIDLGIDVAPHTGAWIEIVILQHTEMVPHVAPHTGAWIEILLHHNMLERIAVAPHTGAWIEITFR